MVIYYLVSEEQKSVGGKSRHNLTLGVGIEEREQVEPEDLGPEPAPGRGRQRLQREPHDELNLSLLCCFPSLSLCF